jgi:hypothetical protein
MLIVRLGLLGAGASVALTAGAARAADEFAVAINEVTPEGDGWSVGTITVTSAADGAASS